MNSQEEGGPVPTCISDIGRGQRAEKKENGGKNRRSIERKGAKEIK